jgi:hypothetical protein
MENLEKNTGNNSNEIYEFVVIGGGGAGLACAEMLSRTSKKILLVEKNKKICNEASGEHHGWFHFGSLYSIFPASKFMRTLINGVEDVIKYYKKFKGMNIYISKDNRIEINEDEEGWLCEKSIDYYIACGNDKDFQFCNDLTIKNVLTKILKRFAWAYMIRKFVARHNQFYSYTWKEGKKAHVDIPNSSVFWHSKKQLKYINNESVKIDVGTHISIQGFDHPMRTMKIVRELLNAYISNGGHLLIETNINKIEKNENVYILYESGREIARAEKIIISTGKYENIIKSMNKNIKLKKTISPLLVTYPNVSESSFVRMTPFMDKTINHICHNNNNLSYSVIGGGYYLDSEVSIHEMKKIETILKTQAEETFINFGKVKHCEIYWGTKTEYVSEGAERNYQYFSKEIDKNIWIAIPGKFSLSFSLAVDLYSKIYGKLPPENGEAIKENKEINTYIGDMKHASIAKQASMS